MEREGGREPETDRTETETETEIVTKIQRETDRDPPAPSAGGLGGDGLVVMNVVGRCTVTESMTRLKR